MRRKNRYARWFIPASIRTGAHNEYQRALLAVKFALGIGTCTAGFSAVLFFIGASIPATYDLGISLLICASPMVMRVTHSVTAGCHALLLSIVVMLVGVSLLGGGMKAPTIPVLVMAPMVAVFLSDRAAGFVWTGIVTLLVVVISIVEALGYSLPQYVDDEYMPFIRTAVYASLFLVAMLFVLFYDNAKQNALAEVNAAHKQIAKMMVHVEATTEALSRSAAEFFGSDLTAADREAAEGLTQQMMTTASTGRDIIDSVGQSIHGMIRQYKQISERVQELHQQSGTIVEMVQTIDSISDRLDLMALNTGIEAANAGEAGKSFMLLADNMRRLAERVTSETQRINQTIRRVHRHTEAAMKASRTGQALTDEGAAELHLMSQAFDELYQLIERTAEASKRVTHDTESQLLAIHNLATASSREPDVSS
ncbi:MAG: methyl-accepting chemotaxis protein [Proteobacteria bacterium]|nr:methyl-accepting chemotaxis protein [Pseudomonadota bacterium]